MQLKRAARVILVGAPGVGKGTQAERLMQRFPQIASISSGDLLRANVRDRTPLGIQAEERMNAGALIPDRTILRLILSELKHKKWVPSQTSVSDAAPTSPSDSPSASFILDGFPRTDLQAQSLSAVIPVNFVVRLITPIDIIIDRIASRWIHPASGRIYNIGFNAPKVAGLDDVTGEKLIQRGDDNPETWRRRLKQFDETSKPLCNFYEKRGLLWTVEGNSSDEISPRLFDEFERRFT